MRPVHVCVCVLGLGLARPAFAQSAIAQSGPSPWSIEHALDLPTEITLSASVRVRYEAIDGQPRAGFNASDQLLSTRASLFGEVRTGAVRFGAELFDSRAHGANSRSPISTGEVDAIEPLQAYLALDLATPFGPGTRATVQAGRFAMSLGSRRLIVNDDYRNTTNGFTGVRADLVTRGGWSATAIYVLPQVRLPDDVPALIDNRIKIDRQSFDLVLWGGLVTKQRAIGSITGEFGFFHLGERDAPGRATRDRSLNTIDAHLIRDPVRATADFEIEGFYQFGHIGASLAPGAAMLAVSAWAVHADLGYSFPGRWKPHVVAEFDAVSGDGPGTTYTRFDTLFGQRRADFAPTGLYNVVARANILTPGLRIEVMPSARIDGFLSYRAMWLAAKTDAFSTSGVRDSAGASGAFAGHQIEARIRRWLVPGALRLELDGDLLLKGRFLKTAPNAPRNGDTRYVSLNLNAYF